MGKRPFYRKVRQTLHETVSDSGKSILCYRGNNDKIYYVASSDDPNVEPGGGMIEVTWQELKSKRDAGELTPGSLYRITDYQCTTTQENTRSAGHQFDIVLLALSENKLAEEGWAMMHDNIYDITFADGVTKKCYKYDTAIVGEDQYFNVVDCETLLGLEDLTHDGTYVIVDEETKTISITTAASTELNVENLTYNYFQNSNLPAWKVWYCLDNDKSRFAWADDSVDEDVDSFITISNHPGIIYYYKNHVGKHQWESSEGSDVYTDSETPENGDTVYNYQKRTGYKAIGEVASYSAAHEGTNLPNGRGVIYRLIDEWNNDIPYDFKNILIYNETYSQYCYAIIDNTENNFDVDPTLDGTKVKAIHVLCDNNDKLKPIAKGGFGNNPLVNIIFLNNNTLADECSNSVVSNGLPIVS